MNKPFNFMLALTMCVAAVVTTSCKGNNDPEVPTQQEIETKIIGKWKQMTKNEKDVLTNERIIKTYYSNNTGIESNSGYTVEGVYAWLNKAPFQYEIKGNELRVESSRKRKILSKITSINEIKLCVTVNKFITPSGEELSLNDNLTFHKVTADYSEAIIGLWEGVEMTGDETYGDANHRIEYKADGTYTYYDKVGDSWVSRKDDISEYNVDGDWLATRWQHTAGDVTNYEWWDIVEIKDSTMKWSALREKDNNRFTTTFTWKKVN